MGLVAMEQLKFPENRRILSDDLAYPILPLSMRAAIKVKAGPFSGDFIVSQAEKKAPGLWGSIMCRKRYIDDVVSETVKNHGVEAVVNLGAGFDTRAYRLPVPVGVHMLELDQPVNIDRKRRRLEKLLGTVPDHVTLIPMDFERDDLRKALKAGDWDAGKATLFLWEGVTQYLLESGVRSTFDFLAEAIQGSRLVFTYIRKDFLDGENLYGLDLLHERMVLKGRIWLFGMDPADMEGILNAYGWQVLDHLGYEDLAGRYVEPTGRKLLSMPIERIVYAQKLSSKKPREVGHDNDR